MRPLITELKWIYLFLFVPFITNGQQAFDSIDLKLVLIEKSIFESKDIKDKNLLLFEKSYIYKNNADNQSAVETLSRVYPHLLSTDNQINYFYELALNNYLLGDYNKADFYLLRLKNISKDAIKAPHIQFLYINNAHKLHKWLEAEEMIYSLGLTKDDSLQLSNAYTTLRNQKLKSAEKAETLSRVLPGVGQMYAGKFFRGLTSSTIQVGVLGFAAYSFLNGFYFSGTLTGVSLFYVFYMGGARHAGYLADEYNKEIISKRLLPINQILNRNIKKGVN